MIAFLFVYKPRSAWLAQFVISSLVTSFSFLKMSICSYAGATQRDLGICHRELGYRAGHFSLLTYIVRNLFRSYLARRRFAHKERLALLVKLETSLTD